MKTSKNIFKSAAKGKLYLNSDLSFLISFFEVAKHYNFRYIIKKN